MAVLDFEKRVRTERVVITRVNQRFVSGSPLRGLTSHAITSWCKDSPERNILQNVLLRLSRLLKREAERSQVTFEIDEQDEQDEAQALQLLDTLLTKDVHSE